jgi:hypothetical protein
MGQQTLAQFTNQTKFYVIHIFTIETAPTPAAVIVFQSNLFRHGEFKHASVALTETLIPAPVTNLLFDICGGIKTHKIAGENTNE